MCQKREEYVNFVMNFSPSVVSNLDLNIWYSYSDFRSGERKHTQQRRMKKDHDKVEVIWFIRRYEALLLQLAPLSRWRRLDDVTASVVVDARFGVFWMLPTEHQTPNIHLVVADCIGLLYAHVKTMTGLILCLWFVRPWKAVKGNHKRVYACFPCTHIIIFVVIGSE